MIGGTNDGKKERVMERRNDGKKELWKEGIMERRNHSAELQHLRDADDLIL